MKLNELLQPWLNTTIPATNILGLENDSRAVKANDLFFALKGARTDGRLHAVDAARQGAVAIVYDPLQGEFMAAHSLAIPCVPIEQLSAQTAAIAARFYQQPSQKLAITGVTGTNGKTTIALQLAQAHERLGVAASYIGTLGQGRVQALQATANTTPNALALQKFLHAYIQSGVKQVLMEVSSHALVEKRVDSIAFKQAIFTNLSQDHLDFHQTMDAYAQAKALLFGYDGLDYAIINEDDAYAAQMKAACNASVEILGYGMHANAAVRALSYEVSMHGTLMDIESPWGRHKLQLQALGAFNVYNSLAIFTSLALSGYPLDSVIAVMPQLEPALGRMEIVHQEPCVVVDYAHTPDALQNVLQTLTQLKQGRIIVVFGCGGDRDKGKRPIMGSIAERFADVLVITNDNPRTEHAALIIQDIQQGIHRKSNVYSIEDRKEAIKTALSLAEPKDIVLVAGKGHENYQEIGKQRHHFSDKEVVKELLS